MLDLEYSVLEYGRIIFGKLQELKVPKNYQEYDKLVKQNLTESQI